MRRENFRQHLLGLLAEKIAAFGFCHSGGSIAPREHHGVPKLKFAPYEKEIRQLVRDHADATLEELHAMLSNKEDVTVVTPTTF